MSSIYTRPRSYRSQLLVGATFALSEQLPFTARSVIVHNHTTQHVFFSDAQTFAPPMTVGYQLPIPQTGRAIARFQAPPNQVDQAAVNGQLCELVYSEEDLPFNPGVPDGQITINAGTVTISGTPSVTISGTPTVNIGNTPSVSISGTPSVSIASGTVSISGTPNINILSQSVNLNTQQPQTALTDLTFPNTGLTNNQTGSIPTGTHALRLLSKSLTNLQNLSVKGVGTGTQYFPSIADGLTRQVDLGPKGALEVVVDSVQDIQFVVAGTNNGATGVVLSVTAILTASAVTVQTPANNPLFTQPRKPRYDGQASAAPAAGTKATVTLAANATKRWVADSMLLGVINTTAAATHLTNGALIDGASGGAAKLAQFAGGLAAAIGSLNTGGADHAYANAAINTALTLEWNAAPAATIQQLVSLGAYLQ